MGLETDDEGPAPGDWGGSGCDGRGPFSVLLGSAGACVCCGCGALGMFACGAAVAGRIGGFKSSSNFGMYAGFGGPA